MFFAICDYVVYKRRAGRFGRGWSVGLMGTAWEQLIPEELLQAITPGSIIFVKRYNNFGSWLIMYLTQSEVSHVAIYRGNGRIVHAVPVRGVVNDSIHSLFGPDVAILPSLLPPGRIATHDHEAAIDRQIGQRYGVLTVLKKGIRILTGRDWVHFRWKFAVDLALLLLVIDTPAWLLIGHPFLSFAIPAYLAVILANAVLAQLSPPSPLDVTNGISPADAVAFVEATGSALMGDAMSVKDRPRPTGAPITVHADQLSPCPICRAPVDVHQGFSRRSDVDWIECNRCKAAAPVLVWCGLVTKANAFQEQRRSTNMTARPFESDPLI